MLSLVSEIARFPGAAMGIAIANRKNRCDFGVQIIGRSAQFRPLRGGGGGWAQQVSKQLPELRLRSCPGLSERGRTRHWPLNSTLKDGDTGPTHPYDRHETTVDSLESVSQEDVNGEKQTVKKWWIFGADFFTVYAEFFPVYKGHIGEKKKISLLMIFFTVRFSRFTPSWVSVHPVYGNPRTGLLRTFWEPDRVLRNPLKSLCVQGALSCPTRRAFLCTLCTETPERAFRAHTKGVMQPHAS